MSTTIASASVRISPDLTDFEADLEAKVRSSIASATAKVKVGADTDEADAEIDRTDAKLDELGHKHVTATVKVDTNDRDAEGLSGLLTTVIALGPALVPAGAAVVGFGAAATASLGAVALGAGVAALALGEVKTEVTRDLTPALTELKHTAASGLLAGIQGDISLLLPELPKVNSLVAGVSAELSRLASDATASLGSPVFRQFFEYIDQDGIPILDEAGHVVGNLGEGLAALLTKFAPVTAEIGQGLDSLSGRFAAGAANSAGLEHFIAYVQTEGPVVGQTLEALGADVSHVLAALAPVGAATLDVVKGFAELTETVPTPAVTALVAALGAGVVVWKAWTAAEKIAEVTNGAFETSLGPIGAALAVAAAGYALFTGQSIKSSEAQNQLAQQVNAHVEALGVSTSSIKVNTSTLADLRAELESTGVGFNKTTGAITVGVQASIELGGSWRNLSNATIDLEQDFDSLYSKTGVMRTNTSALAKEFGLTTTQVQLLAASAGLDLTGKISTLSRQFAAAAAAAAESHHPMAQLALDEQVLGDKAEDATTQLSALTDEFNIFAGNALAAQSASLSFKSDVLALADALKTSHGSLDANTKAGNAALTAFNTAAVGAGTLEDAVLKQTGSVKAARASLEDSIKALQDTAGNSEAASKEIDLLKAALDHLPDSSKVAASSFQANSGQIAKNAREASGQAVSTLTAAVPNAAKAGLEFSQGYASGIASGNDAVVNAAAKVVANAIQTIRDKQQSKSPSQVMKVEGINAGAGYAAGLDASSPTITAAAKRLVADTANALASIEQYVGGTFSTDAAGTPKQVRSGVRGLTDQLANADRHGYLTDAQRKALDVDVRLSSKHLVDLANASKEVTTELGKARSALSTLRGDAASVRSSTLSSFQGLGDPSLLNGVTSIGGVLSVEGAQGKLAKAFNASLATLRHDHLDNAAYAQLVAGGPGQDSSIAALLATATSAQIRQLNKEEEVFTSTGTTAGKGSASYLYGRQITAETRAVHDLVAQQHTLHEDQQQLIHATRQLIDAILKNGRADKQLIRAIKHVGPDTARALNSVASARKQTYRATVQGAHT